MRKLLLLVVIYFSYTTNATTYYISSTGNDSNNGTSPSTSWRTIAKINSRTFLPGDSILFKRGDTWREQLDIVSTGTASHRIVFGAYGTGSKPAINGAEIFNAGWKNYGSNRWGNINPNVTATRAMIIINGVISSEANSLASLNATSKYFIKKGSPKDSLFIYSATNPASLTIEVSKRDFCIRAKAANAVKYVSFINLECKFAGYAGLALFGAVGAQSPSFCEVDSCNFYANRLHGCVAYDGHSNDVFKNSTSTYNGNGFYSWNADYLTISNCSTAQNIRYVVGPNISDGHGYGGYRAGNILIEKCKSNDDWYGVNVDVGGLAKNATIRYNFIQNSKSGTAGIGAGDNLAIGGVIQIYYNVLVNCGGLTASSIESMGLNLGGIKIYNNTIYNNASNGGNGGIFLEHGNSAEIKNNIIASEYVDYHPLFLLYHSGLPLSDNNLFCQYNIGASPIPFYYNGLKNTTLTTWVTATGLDPHSQSRDPLFINKGSDWALQTTSPCINKGVNVGLTKDILGNQVVGLPDIGAYEHITKRPIANAGPDQSITLPINSATITGSGTDPDGQITAYQWTKISGPSTFLILKPANAQTNVANLVAGVYQFELQVTDNSGETAKDTVKVTVNPALPSNLSPLANAGNDMIITLPVNEVLVKGGGTDKDGTLAFYQWSKISGPSQLNITLPTQAQTVIKNLTQGTYQFMLQVTDNDGATGKDTVQVIVNSVTPSNKSPSVNAGNDQVTTLPVDEVSLWGTGIDADGTIASYLWSRISGPTQFTIVTPAQAKTMIRDLTPGIYQFELKITDNLGSIGTDTVAITVNALLNQPPLANAGGDMIVTLPANMVYLPGSGTDPDGTIVSYQWKQLSNSPQIIITSPTLPQTGIEYFAEGVYRFELNVIDNQGAAGKDTVQLTVKKAASGNLLVGYPNPVATTLNLKLDTVNEPTLTNLTIFDARGLIVQKEQFTRNQHMDKKQIDMTPYAKGIYFIQIGNGLNSQKLKVLKQ